jgi:hypothetical protein
MTTILFFFWDGLSEAAITATLVGQWSKVIACHSDQPRIVLHGGSGQLELQGGSDTVEVGG